MCVDEGGPFFGLDACGVGIRRWLAMKVLRTRGGYDGEEESLLFRRLDG